MYSVLNLYSEIHTTLLMCASFNCHHNMWNIDCSEREKYLYDQCLEFPTLTIFHLTFFKRGFLIVDISKIR